MRSLATMPAPSLVVIDSLLREELDLQLALVRDAADTIAELTGAQDSDSAHERDLAERAMNQALDVVAEIEHAIERIARATYGTCIRCGDPIPQARLEAIPYARTCVHCPPPDPLR